MYEGKGKTYEGDEQLSMTRVSHGSVSQLLCQRGATSTCVILYLLDPGFGRARVPATPVLRSLAATIRQGAVFYIFWVTYL